MKNKVRLLIAAGLLFGIQFAQAQILECELIVDDEKMSGSCSGTDEAPLKLSLVSSDDRSNSWEGTLHIFGQDRAISIESRDYSSGSKQIIKTPFGWYLPTRVKLESEPLQLSWSLDDYAPASAQDLAIFEIARSLLHSERVWDRQDDRVCDPSDISFSIYCAFAEATRQVTGKYVHRQPAMRVMKITVSELWPDRIESHRLMDVNNHPDTTFDDIVRMFEEMNARIESELL